MKAFFAWLKKKILHNWGLKLASVLLAFVIWFIVAQVGDPKDTRSFNNIPVRLINVELLSEQNKYYAVIDGTDSVRVSVTAPTSVFQSLRAGDIVAEADVSKLTDINTIAITYYALNANSDYISFEGDHDVVKLEVEDKADKWIRVNYGTVGTVAQGCVIGNISSDQTSIHVVGPKSAVNLIGSADAELNVEGQATTTRANVDIRLKDKEGKQLYLDNVELSTDHVLLTAEILSTKEVPIYVSYSGEPAEGFKVVGTAMKDVDSVVVAGTVTNLSRIKSITIPSDKVDVTGAKDTVEISLNLKDFLPDNVRLADPEVNQINVTVTVKATKERTMEIPAQNIALQNIPANYKVSLPEDETERLPVTLKVYGLLENVNALKPGSITGTADVEAWMRSRGSEELPSGYYDVPVSFTIGSDVKVLESGTVRVEITKQE